MARKAPAPPPIELKVFRDPAEIERGIAKLRRRIDEVAAVDVRKVVLESASDDEIVMSNVREAIRGIFGQNSPEFQEHQYMRLWAGGMFINMPDEDIIEAKEKGKSNVQTILNGLIARLNEKKEEFAEPTADPNSYFRQLNLHQRIADAANDLFLDGYHWEAVFAAAKTLVNYVKDRSGKHDLDGAALMRAVFSKNSQILAFNILADQTDLDEQEGMMHLFEGAVLAIRNPGGHDFPEGSAQRALEYISFLSLLAYRVQEAKRIGRSGA